MLTERCVKDGPLMKLENSEANRIMYDGDLRISFFTRRRRYTYDTMLTDRCIKDGPWMKLENSEANRIMYD